MHARCNRKRQWRQMLSLVVGILCLSGITAQTIAETHLDTLRRAFAENRLGMFCHYNMNTFSQSGNVGASNVSVSTYNPSSINPAQWVSAAKQAKMKFMVLTAKHHDGFCIWDTKLTDYKCTASGVNANARKDVVALFVKACKDSGIMPGIYYSVQDRSWNNGALKIVSTDPLNLTVVDKTTGRCPRTYIDYTMGQIKELVTNYGEIPFFVDDGWAWSSGHTIIPYQEFRDTLIKYSPNTLFSEHAGLFYPWQEDIIYFEHSKNENLWPDKNNIYACWLSNKCTGGSNGWFWGTGVSSVSKTVSDILTTYVDRCDPYYCAVAPNLPPDNRGLLPDGYVTWLKSFGASASSHLTPNRAPLPPQPPHMDYVITAVNATSSAGGTPRKAIDGISDGGWADRYTQSIFTMSSLNQNITVDLGKSYTGINMCQYLPVQIASNDATGLDNKGAITGYEISYSTSSSGPFTGVKLKTGYDGTWAKDITMKIALFEPVTARYMRLTATASLGGTKAEFSELDFGYDYQYGRSGTPIGAASRPTARLLAVPQSSVNMVMNLRDQQAMPNSPLTQMSNGITQKIFYSLDGRKLYSSTASQIPTLGAFSSKAMIVKKR